MRKKIIHTLLFLALSLTTMASVHVPKRRRVRRRSALVLDSDTTISGKKSAAATEFVEADDETGKGRRQLKLFSAKGMKHDLLHGAKSFKKDLLHLRGSKSSRNYFFGSKSTQFFGSKSTHFFGSKSTHFFGKSSKARRHSCMDGRTGFTKVGNHATSSTSSENEQKSASTTITQVRDLQVGDKVVGLNDERIRTNECEVVSVIDAGEATTFGNYTYEHFILSKDDPDTLVMHGRAGYEGRDGMTVYQVLSTCPVITDESGNDSSFSLCARSLSGEEERIPWGDYVAIHGSILKLVRATGVRDLSALKNKDKAVAHMPTLCATGLECARSGDCGDFEAAMTTFAKDELVPEALGNVFSAFRTFGEAVTKIPVLSII